MLAGMTLTFAYAPFSHWWITPLALTFVFCLYCTQKSHNKFALGFWFGVGWFGAGISWVHVSIANFGGLPLIGSLGLMALLVSYLALFPALIFYLSEKCLTENQRPLGIAILWFLVEWVRSWFLTGFPWLSLGYSQLHSPLNGWFPIVGETGLTALLVLACYVCAVQLIKGFNNDAIRRHLVSAISIPVILVIASWTARSVPQVTPNADTVKMAMVQGNIQQELRWVPEQDLPTMQTYLDMTSDLWGNDIILWPEAAIPKLEPLAQNYINAVDELAFETDTGLITGIVNYNFETTEAFNNLIALGKIASTNSSAQYTYFHANRYGKHHLLPVGEFIPMEDWLRGLAPIFDLPMSSFSRGDYMQRNLKVNDYHFLPAICFEIAFPRQIAANLRTHTDFLLTVSNDAWFGNSHGPAQHLEIAQVRALEFGLPLLRATNNGITAFVDHKGEIIAAAPQFQAATLSAQLHTVSGHTLYRYWGDAPMWLIAIAFLFYLLYFLVTSGKRNKENHKFPGL